MEAAGLEVRLDYSNQLLHNGIKLYRVSVTESPHMDDVCDVGTAHVIVRSSVSPWKRDHSSTRPASSTRQVSYRIRFLFPDNRPERASSFIPACAACFRRFCGLSVCRCAPPSDAE